MHIPPKTLLNWYRAKYRCEPNLVCSPGWRKLIQATWLIQRIRIEHIAHGNL